MDAEFKAYEMISLNDKSVNIGEILRMMMLRFNSVLLYKHVSMKVTRVKNVLTLQDYC